MRRKWRKVVACVGINYTLASRNNSEKSIQVMGFVRY